MRHKSGLFFVVVFFCTALVQSAPPNTEKAPAQVLKRVWDNALGEPTGDSPLSFNCAFLTDRR